MRSDSLPRRGHRPAFVEAGALTGLLPNVGPFSVAGLDVCDAVFVHDRDASRLVRAIKDYNDRGALGPVADAMAARAIRLGLTDAGIEAVGWVPTAAPRRRDRGFDHAGLLARALARRLGLPARRLLRRTDGGRQGGSTRDQRLIGPQVAATGVMVRRPHRRVLLVDDVVTTGASMTASANALRAAGTEWIAGLALTRRP